jgi:tetratricopeptide (TPR) repeat protein
MFSTAAGDVAEDGKGRRNSPFAEAFLKYINSPEPLVLMASDVINETMARTNNAQRPFSRGSIISDKRYSLNPDRQAATYAGADMALEFFEEGQSRMSGNTWDGAVESFTVAIRLDPQFTKAYTNRGLAYTNKSDYDRAVADFTESIRLAPQVADGYALRGIAYHRKGDDDRAVADFTESIRLNPQNAAAYVTRGDAYYNKGDYDRAIADSTATLRLDPKNAAAFNVRGLAYTNKGDYDRAVADYTEALRINPNHTQAKDNLEAAKRRGK